MQLVKDAECAAGQTGAHRFVVNLTAHESGAVEVRNCEVIGPHHRNRFTFPIRVNVEDVFVEYVARGVQECLASLSDKTEVVSLPSLAIEMPGLSLATAHLITTRTEHGALGIILRFKMLLGNINRAFKPTLGVEASVCDHASHTSSLVLTDIVMPLLDLCAAAEVGRFEPNAGYESFVDTLLERSHEMRFQAELIKRFVANDANNRQKREATPRRVTKPKLVAESGN